MKIVCVDAGFLIGLYTENDPNHNAAKNHFLELFEGKGQINRMLIPWPILYEAISTKMVKNRERMQRLESDWKKLSLRNRLELLEDGPYRERVIQDCFDELGRPVGSYRRLSTVDRVIRNILADRDIRIDAFVTYNIGDFADVCGNIELVY